MHELTAQERARYFSKVSIPYDGNPEQCWNWIGTRNSQQYGKIVIRGKWYGAHRVAWFLATGEDSADMFVCHTCDNKLCVNPAHLFLGSPQDNARDMVNKGRHTSPDISGERNPRAKLCDADIPTIRQQVARGARTSGIARAYEVSRQTIDRIAKNQTWQHIKS
jgi:hypothetical protein